MAVTAGTLGLATEGFSKAGIQYGWGAPKPVDALTQTPEQIRAFQAREKTWETKWKNSENFGKTIGGYANVGGGVLSFINGAKAFQKGDVANGVLNIVGGSFSVASGVASAVEGLANLGLFGDLSKVALGRFAFVAGALGWASAGIGFLVAIIPSIIFGVQQEKDWKNAGGNIKDLRDKYDIASATDSEDSDWPEVKGQGIS